MLPHSMENQETTFYEELQNCKALDLRDDRGKVHDLSFVLLGIIIGLLRNRDGNLSSIHRSMENKNEELCAALDIEIQLVISRAHLPRVMKKVRLDCLEQLLYQRFGIQLQESEKKWFAVDGKELRGSIEKGSTRGEARVQAIEHSQRIVVGHVHYRGDKESEKPCVQGLIEQKGLSGQKITTDALHLCPAMTEPIQASNGVFLIGLKDNQKLLLQDMKDHINCFSPVHTLEQVDKGHGRLDKRYYELYDVSEEYFDPRWAASRFRSLLVVHRERMFLNNKELEQNTAYYISNGEAKKENEYFEAIRNHWQVEVNHHLRDVTLKEDHLRTIKTEVTHVFSGLRTVVLEMLRRLKPKSVIAKIETFQDNFDQLISDLRLLNVL